MTLLRNRRSIIPCLSLPHCYNKLCGEIEVMGRDNDLSVQLLFLYRVFR